MSAPLPQTPGLGRIQRPAHPTEHREEVAVTTHLHAVPNTTADASDAPQWEDAPIPLDSMRGLPEFPTDATLDMDTVAALVERYANYAASTRAAIDEAEKSGDATTADLFTQISAGIDKGLWFLEAHLQK